MTTIEDRLTEAAHIDVRDARARASAVLAQRADAEGLVDVAWASMDSPVGRILLAATAKGLAALSYGPDEEFLETLADRLSPRVLAFPARLDPARRELDEYFSGKRSSFDLPLDWSLSEGFARRVLERTAAIPYGSTATYGQVAADAGSPRGARAAGQALGANPIAIVVPCHRVCRSSGNLGGYGGGLDAKRWLLDLEAAA